MLAEQDRGEHCDDAVAVEFTSVGKNRASTVNVRIKDNAKISTSLLDGSGDALHSFLILGVGNVVGEATVGVQESAALGVCA